MQPIGSEAVYYKYTGLGDKAELEVTFTSHKTKGTGKGEGPGAGVGVFQGPAKLELYTLNFEAFRYGVSQFLVLTIPDNTHTVTDANHPEAMIFYARDGVTIVGCIKVVDDLQRPVGEAQGRFDMPFSPLRPE